MGTCFSNLTPDERIALQANRRIEVENRKDFQDDQDKVKLLLLGAGESGKSTLFKQMKILYGKGFSESEKKSYIPRIGFNIMEGMQILCQAVMEMELQDKLNESSNPYVEKMLSLQPVLTPPDAEMAEIVHALWKDPAIQQAWDLRSAFQVNEAVSKFFDTIDDLIKDDYVPTQDDILLCRVRTTGITSSEYLIDGVTFALYDVGGQQNERKKWIHCFDNVNAVLFVAALSEYDQVLFENSAENRMVDAINLFKWVNEQSVFANTAMILFLNKRDLFETKVMQVPISSIEQFSDFAGKEKNFTDGVAYFQKKFETQVPNRETKQIYTHITCATDSENIRYIFNTCKDIILNQNLVGDFGPVQLI